MYTACIVLPIQQTDHQLRYNNRSVMLTSGLGLKVPRGHFFVVLVLRPVVLVLRRVVLVLRPVVLVLRRVVLVLRPVVLVLDKRVLVYITATDVNQLHPHPPQVHCAPAGTWLFSAVPTSWTVHAVWSKIQDMERFATAAINTERSSLDKSNDIIQ